MDIAGEPRSPTLDFKGLDDTTTYELFDEGSVSQTRKRRRSSLRRVSFAERPSIHVFARDDDYETPPEGTTSHFSGQSSPGTSMSTSPQRRSGRLIAAARGRENEMEKENTVPNLSVGSNARDGRRGRRPLAIRGNDKVKESEEFLKPSTWLDEPEASAFGSCDENTGPVDLRHISFGEQRTTVEDDDNVTMDSQTFKTRMSLVLARQPLQPLSEEKFVHVATPTDTNTDMELTAFETERKLQGKHRPPTWHRGDNSPSDMSLSLGPMQWKFSHIGSSQKRKQVGGDDDDRSSGLLEDSQLQSRKSNIQMNKLAALPANDDTVSMDTTSMDTTLDSVDGNNLTEEGDKMPSSGTMRFADPKDNDDTVSMDITGQSLTSQTLENTETFDKNLKDCEDDRSLVNEDYSEPLEQDSRNVLESSAVNLEIENSLLQGQSIGLERQDAYQPHDETININNNSKVFKEHVHLAADNDSFGALQQNEKVAEVSATNSAGEKSLSQGRSTFLKSSESFQAHDDTVTLNNNSNMFKAHTHSAADDDCSGTSKENGKVTEVRATKPENDRALSQGRGSLLERLDSLQAHDETVTFKNTSKVFKDNLHSTADDGAFGALKQNGKFTEVSASNPEGEGRGTLLERLDSLQAHDETVTFKNNSKVFKNNVHSTVDDGAFGGLKQNGKFTEVSALNSEGESSLSQGRSMLLARLDSLQAHDETVTFKNTSKVFKDNLHSTADDGAFGALKQNGKFTEVNASNPEGEGRSMLLERLDLLQAHDETVTFKNTSKVFKGNLHSTADDSAFGALKQNGKFTEVNASNPEGEGRSTLLERLDLLQAHDETVTFKNPSKVLKNNAQSTADDGAFGAFKQNRKFTEESASNPGGESSLFQGRSILQTRLDSMQAHDDMVTFKTNSKLVNGNLHSAADDDDFGASKQNGKVSVSAPTSESETSLTKGRNMLLKRLNTVQPHHENDPMETLSQERDSRFDPGRGAQGFNSGATVSYVSSRGPFVSKGHNDTVSLEATSQSQPNKFQSEGQMGNSYPGNDETVSMDITRALTGRIQQIASAQRLSTDSAKPFVWLSNVQDMDLSDADVTDKFQDRVTAAIPHLKDLLDAYPETPSAPGHNARLAPLPALTNQNSQRGIDVDTETFEGPNLRRGNILLRGADRHEASDIPTIVLTTNLERKEPFRDSEDTFSFKVPQQSSQKKKRESLEGPSEERAFASQQVGAFRPMLSDVQDTVHSMESNPWNNSSAALQKLGPNLQDGDDTRELTNQDDWLGDASSDMSTTPLSPRRPNFLQGLTNNPQGSAMQTGSDFMDSPSLQDGITASIPKVKDLLAADEGASESESAWNPRRISWSTQHQSHQTVGDIPASMCQPRLDPTEDETIHSMPDNLRTPGVQNKEDDFLSMTNEGANALNVMSHTKEVQNSAANRKVQRLIYLKDKDSSEEDSNPHEESPQILRRSLTFHPDTDSQPHERLLMQGKNMHQRDLEDFDSQSAVPKSSSGLFASVQAAMDPSENQERNHESDSDVQLNQSVDEDAASRSMQELKRAKVLLELRVAEEKLADLERQSGVLRDKAEFLHQAVADRCMERDWRIGTKEWANLCPYTLVKKLKKHRFLMSGVQWWDMKTTKTGDDEVTHVFKYWSLLTHSIHQKTANRLEVEVVKSTIDLNQGIIDQTFRHINASLAWESLLSGHEKIMPRCSQLYLVQDVSLKVTILLDLMGEVNKCRKYLVIPRFLLSTDEGVRLKLQFSNRELLFDFAVLLDLREWLGQKENMACEVNLEASGRYGGRKITVDEIKKAVTCISPGDSRLLRICASVESLIESIRMKPMTGSEADDQEAWIRDLIFN